MCAHILLCYQCARVVIHADAHPGLALDAITQVVGMHMAKRRAGHIINNGSTASMIGVPYNASYCASKWAVEGLTHTLRNEMRPLGVKVTYLAPGAVKTNLLRPNTVNPPPAGSPFAAYQEMYNKVYLE